jgi:hypothetical protein
MAVVGGDAAGMSAAAQAKRLAGDKLKVVAPPPPRSGTT